MQEQLTHLRAELAQIHHELIEAEAELADRLAEVNAFEFEFEARVGYLFDTLEALEKEIQWYTERMQTLRSKQVFGQAHVPVDVQYRRAWQAPPPTAPTPPPQPLNAAGEAEIKRLYRQLARRFHPDLAVDEADRTRRTEKMAAVNNAYAARSLVELVALAAGPDTTLGPAPDQTETQLIQALQAELHRCQSRRRQIQKELRNVRFRPSVELSIEVKMARRQGRDLLAEMAADLKQKIARQTAERDMLKAQFDQLGPEQGFIRIER
ncbi:MAG: J domain-containing protein [Anaerolineae bacterium]|nr:J domain-containing protein [Anaerolineae bacterium]